VRGTSAGQSLYLKNAAVSLVLLIPILLMMLALGTMVRQRQPPTEPMSPIEPLPIEPPQTLPHDQPPIITLKESEGFSFPSGSADVSGEFRIKLSQIIVPIILATSHKYYVTVIEVIGHTDEVPLSRKASNLDLALIPFLNDNTISLVASDNAGLGMARAIAVLSVLMGDQRLSQFQFIPYSAGQMVLRGDRLSDGTDRQASESRRRIEISLRKPR